MKLILLFDFFEDDSNTSAVKTLPLKEDAANGFDEFLCVTDSCLLVLKILSRIDDTDKFAMFNILSYNIDIIRISSAINLWLNLLEDYYLNFLYFSCKIDKKG